MVSVTIRARTSGIVFAGLMLCGFSAQAQGVAPIPVNSAMGSHLILASGMGDQTAALAHTQSMLPLMAQPLTLMAGAPVADPARVAQILGSPSTLTVNASAAAVITATDTSPDAKKVDLYLKLMELNGTSNNVRMILKNAKDSIRMVVIQRAGTVSLTPQQELIYDQSATEILKQTEADLIHDIAQTQSKAFTEEEVAALLRANSSPAAQKYNAAKYVAPYESVSQIQSYMVDAVYKILKTYKQAVAS